ncbi:hypothetical protein Ssed_1713 [Shewanella sediminis HAW-EB3]|uniref:DUF997 family protein n=1 Tax=Shewanella sediminis (strain HAW-EB3) TaxID=425104 RepID=A8FU01_SHESH|nr:hypothetical protein Ssed_1713 [Shewanella sediminis HAW-EB3]
MLSLSKTALNLTFIYFCLWCAGPLFFDASALWYGVPVWFWLSCIGAPLTLIALLINLVGRIDD